MGHADPEGQKVNPIASSARNWFRAAADRFSYRHQQSRVAISGTGNRNNQPGPVSPVCRLTKRQGLPTHRATRFACSESDKVYRLTERQANTSVMTTLPGNRQKRTQFVSVEASFAENQRTIATRFSFRADCRFLHPTSRHRCPCRFSQIRHPFPGQYLSRRPRRALLDSVW